MKLTLQSWYCTEACGQRNEASARHCQKCGRNHYERNAQVASSERAVVYLNPATGERKTPPRADQLLPEIYARQGFERHEIMSMTAYEKETGVVHEATNFHPGNELTAFREPEPAKASPELVNRLVNEIRAANQSGPWTMDHAEALTSIND